VSTDSNQAERRILRRADVEARCGFKRAHLYKLIRDGRFPRPLRIGIRAVGWDSVDIDPMDRRTGAAAYLARKTQMLSSAGSDCAQNRASSVCAAKRIASAVSSADLAGSQQTRRRRDRKCNLSRGRARGILAVDEYSLATRASS
jgi:prophage regulatory protein